MGAFVHPITDVCWENMGCTLMARIIGNDGSNAQQADITGITCKVFDTGTDEATPSDEPAVVVATAIFDALQTDARWTKDEVGYNFRFPIAEDIFANAGNLYIVEFVFDPSGAGEAQYPAVYRITPQRLLGE